MKIYAQKALIEGKFENDIVVTAENGRIAAVEKGGPEGCDRTAPVLTQGLFDIHQHGGLGFDCSRPDDELCRKWLGHLAKHGVTNVLYTVSTGDPEVMNSAIAYAAKVMAAQKAGTDFAGARVEGVHMEGPFISTVRSGAMAKEKIQAPSMAQFERLTGENRHVVRSITIAPEVEGAAETAKAIAAMGIRVQAGHTDATCAEAQKAFREDGFRGVTHFYNAARPLTQREPGILGAALTEDAVYCEAICDFVHVSPEMLKVLIKCKGPDRVCVISDSVTTAGLPDGEYFGGNHSIIVKNNRNLTVSGGIAGGWVQADTGLRDLISIGIPEEDALRMGGTTPAEYIGIPDIGAVAVGKRACLAAWDKDYNCLFSLQDGSITGED